MKKFILSLFLIFLLIPAFGQFYYTISSEPDSAVVSINGKEIGHTPYRAKYYWRQKNSDNQVIFSVQADGYETWSDTITSKPKTFDKRTKVVLKQTLPSFKFDSASVFVAYDKLLAVFENGEQIGTYHYPDGKTEPVKWEGTIKTGSKSFEKKFYEIVTNSGIPTPITKNSALFADESSKKNVLPRYIIGAQIIEYNVIARKLKKDKFSAGRVISDTWMKVEWKVYDKATDKVVISHTNEGKIRLRDWNSSNNTLIAFENALIDFLNTGKLSGLIRDAKEEKPLPAKIDSLAAAFEIKVSKKPLFNSISEMVKHSSQACVTIITDDGHGSGVIIDTRGYLVTAYHVVEGVNKLKVKFENGIELDAQIISYDSPTDLALLKINGNGFSAIPFSKDNSISIGEEVLTIGTPADVELGQSISRGMISGKRSVENDVYIQLDIAISPGNSGGPLLNHQGEIVGIVQKKIVGKGIEGIGFAIPSQRVKEIFGLSFIE